MCRIVSQFVNFLLKTPSLNGQLRDDFQSLWILTTSSKNPFKMSKFRPYHLKVFHLELKLNNSWPRDYRGKIKSYSYVYHYI